MSFAGWRGTDGCDDHHFDIGGVLSKYPDILRPTIIALLAAPGIEVHVLSDMHPHSKAVKARELDLHVLWDDFVGYVATVGAPPIRLLVMPDPTRDYYHESWKTDGSEGSFGRRMQRKTQTEGWQA